MLRLLGISDLHIDIQGNDWTPGPVPEGVDVVVIAGDVQAPLSKSLRWSRKHFPDHRIIYVAGNHDFYSHGDPKAVARDPEIKTNWIDEQVRGEIIAREEGIDFLNDRTVTIDGVDFHGSTLWTDFKLNLDVPSRIWGMHDNIRVAAGRNGMNDYKLIKVPPGRSRDMLRPADTIAAHKKSREWIETALLTSMVEGRESVLVTHHAPAQSVRQGDMDWCYGSKLDSLCEGAAAPVLWLHGHVHRNNDYMLGSTTRVVSNPRGYPEYSQYKCMSGPVRKRENDDFNPELVIEVGCEPTCKMGI